VPHAHHQAFGPRAPSGLLRLVLGMAGVAIVIALCAAPVIAKKTPPAQPIDLNAANVKELEELPGIGPTTAKAIIDFRTKSGRFRRVNDLLVIRGISEAKLAKIRPYVTIGPPPKPVLPAPAKKQKPSP
jgi:competence ComEA-like helix-hairpin-helix protein